MTDLTKIENEVKLGTQIVKESILMAEKSISKSVEENKLDEAARPAAYARILARMPKYISHAMQMARPLAYASEVGESFRKVAPYIVKPLYAISIGYVLLDIGIKNFNVKHKNSDYRKRYLADISIWHLGASLVFPALVINRYIHTLAYVLGKTNVPLNIIRWAPTISALCLIPFIVHPLDHFTDWAMDNSYRKYVNFKNFDDEPTLQQSSHH